MKHGKGVRSHKRKTIEVSTNKEIKQCSSHKYSNSLMTRPGFSFKEPRRVASAGLVRKVKIYHSSIDLLVLDGFGGAWWCNNSIPQ